jgi:hypothetical protein
MPLRTVQTNFTSGMLDDKVRDHLDLAAYRNGAKEIGNCRVLPQGGATRRPGGDVRAKLAGSDYQIESFVFSSSQAYCLLFYDSAVDVWDKITRTYLATVAGPWTAGQIASGEMAFEQQLDKMFVSHPDFETQVITRTGFSSFTIGAFAWATDAAGTIVYQAYHKFAPALTTLSLSTASVGAVTATASAGVFTASHVGTKIRYRKCQISVTGFTNATTVTGTLDQAAPAATADYDWDEQAFSAVHGWARCFCLHLQRLWIGGGRDCPNVLWGSSLNDPFNMDLGTGADDDAIKAPIYARRVAEIVSMVSNVHLQIFTTHGEFYVPKPDSVALTPGTVSVEQQSGFGSAALQARQFDQTTVFVTRKARALREFVFDAVQTSYASDALTFMSKSLLSGPRDLDVQMEGEGEEQESRAYVSNDDGTIAVLAKVRKENIAGWSYWSTEGSYRRLGVVDAEVWAVVERTVNGVTALYLEIFDTSRFLDFSAVASGPAATSWGPFNLHKGAEVHMRSGDLYLGTATVDAVTGMVEAPTEITEIEIGFNFEPRVIPLPQHVQLADGVSVGLPKRYVSCTANLVETLSCQIKNKHISSIAPDDDPGQAPPRYTGAFKAWMLGWKPSSDIVIRAPYPLPFTLNSLVTEVEV